MAGVDLVTAAGEVRLAGQVGRGTTAACVAHEDLWEATPKSSCSNDLRGLQPNSNPPKEFDQLIFNGLGLSEATDYAL